MSATRLRAIPLPFALLPYLAVSLVHLASKPLELSALDQATKPLLMPALLLGLALTVATREPAESRTRRTLALLALGVALSWVGDITLADFVVGLGFFLLAHLAYLGVFWRTRRLRLSWGALLALPWFAGLLAVLWPHLGGLLPVVALYGVVLGAMAVSATRVSAVAALGGLLFLVSDSLLAFRLFTPYLQSPWEDAAIMAAYLAGQVLLVMGVHSTLVASATREPVASGR